MNLSLLRLDLLKKGLVQFTDATTAARLFREHGRDIRYNAAWKKSCGLRRAVF
jgi:putative DNA primase/helicase